jgi:hypothetical protein
LAPSRRYHKQTVKLAAIQRSEPGGFAANLGDQHIAPLDLRNRKLDRIRMRFKLLPILVERQ